LRENGPNSKGILHDIGCEHLAKAIRALERLKNPPLNLLMVRSIIVGGLIWGCPVEKVAERV
jgi:hypothetical protein